MVAHAKELPLVAQAGIVAVASALPRDLTQTKRGKEQTAR